MDGNVQQTILTHPWTGKIPGYVDAVSHHNQLPFKEGQEREFYKNLHDGSLNMEANMSADYCEHYPEEAMKHLLLIFTSRFFKDSSRFMHNGQGNLIRTAAGYAYNGCHLMHGPGIPYVDSEISNGGGPQDILILRPNIEHEMLGIIMGRGGTQELGATFWGQTELSCYDDSQHGIWGMSYK